MTRIKVNKNDIILVQEMYKAFNLIAKETKVRHEIPEVRVLSEGSLETYTLNEDAPKVHYFISSDSYKEAIKFIKKIIFYKNLYPAKIRLGGIADYSTLVIKIDIEGNNYRIPAFTFNIETGRKLEIMKAAASLLDLDRATKLLALNLETEERRLREGKKNINYIKKAMRWAMSITKTEIE